MNPTISQAIVDRALERDPQAAASEYLARWRDAIASYLSRDALDAVVDPGVLERLPDPTITYYGHVDPAGGGQGGDSMVLAISHLDRDGLAILDKVIEVRSPFSPREVISAFAHELGAFNIRSVSGDRYGGEFPREIFRDHGIAYELSSRTASDGYLAFMPLLHSHRVRLLDHLRLLAQLQSLERRVSPSGKDLVTHPRFGHDDCSNAAALALVAAADHGRTDDSQILAANLASTSQRVGLSTDMGDMDAMPLVDGWDDFAPINLDR
jgi:hypothetical protein